MTDPKAIAFFNARAGRHIMQRQPGLSERDFAAAVLSSGHRRNAAKCAEGAKNGDIRLTEGNYLLVREDAPTVLIANIQPFDVEGLDHRLTESADDLAGEMRAALADKAAGLSDKERAKASALRAKSRRSNPITPAVALMSDLVWHPPTGSFMWMAFGKPVMTPDNIHLNINPEGAGLPPIGAIVTGDPAGGLLEIPLPLLRDLAMAMADPDPTVRRDRFDAMASLFRLVNRRLSLPGARATALIDESIVKAASGLPMGFNEAIDAAMRLREGHMPYLRAAILTTAIDARSKP